MVNSLICIIFLLIISSLLFAKEVDPFFSINPSLGLGSNIRLIDGLNNFREKKQTIITVDDKNKELKDKGKSLQKVVPTKVLYKNISYEFNGSLELMRDNKKAEKVNTGKKPRLVILKELDSGWKRYKVIRVREDGSIIYPEDDPSKNPIYIISKDMFGAKYVKFGLVDQLSEESQEPCVDLDLCKSVDGKHLEETNGGGQWTSMKEDTKVKVKRTLVDEYSNCQSEKKFYKKYIKNYKPFLKKINVALYKGEGHDLMACLFLRESYAWRGIKSDDGAFSLAQLMPSTLKTLKVRLSKDASKWQGLIKKRLGEIHENVVTIADLKKIKNPNKATKERLENLKGDTRTLRRMVKSYDLSLYLRLEWDKLISNKHLFSKEEQKKFAKEGFVKNKFTKSYLSNNKNYKVVFALGNIRLKSCIFDLNRYDGKKYEGLNDETKIIICTGAYNMGEGDFFPAALKKNGKIKDEDHTIKKLVKRLRKSKDIKSSNKTQTSDHLISIDRCSDKNNQYPMCGTGYTKCKYYQSPCKNKKQETLYCYKKCKK